MNSLNPLMEEVPAFAHDETLATEPAPARPLNIALLNAVPDPVESLAVPPTVDEEDLTEDLTIEEFYQREAEPPATPEYDGSPLIRFMISPFYPSPFYLKVFQYFKEVRQRMIESHEFDKVQYYDTLYQKFCRFVQRSIMHMKANLAT